MNARRTYEGAHGRRWRPRIGPRVTRWVRAMPRPSGFDFSDLDFNAPGDGLSAADIQADLDYGRDG